MSAPRAFRSEIPRSHPKLNPNRQSTDCGLRLVIQQTVRLEFGSRTSGPLRHLCRDRRFGEGPMWARGWLAAHCGYRSAYSFAEVRGQPLGSPNVENTSQTDE